MVAALNSIDVRAEIATTNDDGESELDVDFAELIDFNGAPSRFFKRYSSTLRPLREFQYAPGFNRWLKAHIDSYDLIHVHAIFSACSTYAMWLARKRGIPYIVRPIGQLENWALRQGAYKKRLYLRLIEKSNLQAASAIQFTSDSEAQQALSLVPEINSHVIPLG
ncbi:MAG: glycosyltransferase, partial [Arenicella sp.]|nr:glycosyltransferase [Arenicella sp.]